MLLAYFGPETTLPVTSALAAVAGFGLMFGRQVIRVARVVLRRMVGGLGTTASGPATPMGRTASVRARRDRSSTPHHAHEVGKSEQVDA